MTVETHHSGIARIPWNSGVDSKSIYDVGVSAGCRVADNEQLAQTTAQELKKYLKALLHGGHHV